MIYTKKGDQGQTRFAPKSAKVSKADAITQLSGTIDEWNAYVGHVLAICSDLKLELTVENTLLQIQKLSFQYGAKLFDSQFEISPSDTLVQDLERFIDAYQAKLPRLKHFIYFNQNSSLSQLNIARVHIRRVERELVSFQTDFEWIKSVLPLINRLSDAIFIIQRWVLFSQEEDEKLWKSNPK